MSEPSSDITRRAIRVIANCVGALGAAVFARAGLQHYHDTHSLVGAAFLVTQLWIVVAYLVRRPASAVSQQTGDWLLAFGGTFAGVLYRPSATHIPGGVEAGFALQIVGLVICTLSFVSLGRSFGFAAADRGLKCRGSYAVVRHPIYASYFILQLGYVVQSPSVRNLLVMVLVCSCDLGRVAAEERVLFQNPSHANYRAKVRWKLLPGVW